jgi:Lactonase, 7-bladed beta-propeller
MTVARNQDFLFVGSAGITTMTPDKDLISTYRIDPDTGALTQVASLNTLFPANMAVDLSGKFLYIGDVVLFSINASGELAQIPGESAAAMPFTEGDFVFSPTEHFLYTWGTPDGHGDPGPFAVAAALNPQTGILSDGQMLGLKTNGLVVTADGKFMVLTTGTGVSYNQVCTYAIDPRSGVPAGSLAGTGPAMPVACATTADLLSAIALHPGGGLVAVAGAPGVTMFSLSNGNLTQISHTAFPPGMALPKVSFSRDGKYLFVAGPPDGFVIPAYKVLVFQVNADTGVLTEAPGSPFILSAAPGHMVP